MADKIYIGDIKEKLFEDGGSVLNVGISKADLEKMLTMVNQKDYINLKISKRREPSQYGHTHSMVVDTWKPDTDAARQAMGSVSSPPIGQVAPAPRQPQRTQAFDDDIPF